VSGDNLRSPSLRGAAGSLLPAVRVTLALGLFTLVTVLAVRPAAGEDSREEAESAAEIQVALHQDAGWQLYRRNARGGVDIHRKKVGALVAFRGEKTVNASSDLLFEVLLDLEHHVGLSEQIPLSRSEVLDRKGDVFDYMQYIDSPKWTLTRDRYWFNRATVRRDLAGVEGHHRQSWQGIDPARYPRRWRALLADHEGAIQTPVNHGSWEVIPMGPQSCKLVYRVLSDPGGTLPRAIQLLVTATTLPESMLQFEAEALRRRGS